MGPNNIPDPVLLLDGPDGLIHWKMAWKNMWTNPQKSYFSLEFDHYNCTYEVKMKCLTGDETQTSFLFNVTFFWSIHQSTKSQWSLCFQNSHFPLSSRQIKVRLVAIISTLTCFFLDCTRLYAFVHLSSSHREELLSQPKQFMDLALEFTLHDNSIWHYVKENKMF